MAEHIDTSGLRHGLQQILDEAMDLDGAAFGKIRIAKPADGVFEIAVQRGFSDRFVEAFRTITRDDECPSARAARTGKRVAVPDVARQAAQDPFLAAARDEGVRGMQATPIVTANGRVVGTLSTLFRHAYGISIASALVLDHHARRAAALIETLLPAGG